MCKKVGETGLYGEYPEQPICFTSPLPKKSSASLNDLECLTPEIVVSTPPTPDSSFLLGTTPINHEESRFKQILRRCRISRDQIVVLESLGWVAEELLYSSLSTIGKILNSEELLYCNSYLIKLENLRDAFIKSAVYGIEASLAVHESNFHLSSSSLAILRQFQATAQHIRQLRNSSVAPFVTSSLVTPLMHGLSTTEEKIPQHLYTNENPEKSYNSYTKLQEYRGKNFQTDSLEFSFKPKLIKPEINEILNGSTAKEVKSPLSKRFLKIIKRNCIRRINDIFQQPFCKGMENFISSDHLYDEESVLGEEASDFAQKRSYLLTSPVRRHAQKQLGEIWNRIDTSSLTSLLESINSTKKCISTSNEKVSGARSQLKTVGAFDLMGAKAARKGQYVSRRRTVNKARNTRRKNKKKKKLFPEFKPAEFF